jgi:broad specificity phosphatase PhoE
MRNKYIIMRHGETKYQAKKSDIIYPKYQNSILPITKKGKEVIKKTAREFKNKNIDLIYCSDFYRTRQTAKIIAKELGLEIILDKRLRDTDFGVFSGKTGAEYQSFFSEKKERFFKRPAQGENWKDVRKRVLKVIKEIEQKHNKKKILIVSHADPVWLLTGYLKGLDDDELLEQRNPQGVWPDVGQYFEIL